MYKLIFSSLVQLRGRERREKVRERSEKRGQKREERREKREDKGEWVPRSMWTPRQHLMVNLTQFDHFNGLSYDMG